MGRGAGENRGKKDKKLKIDISKQTLRDMKNSNEQNKAPSKNLINALAAGFIFIAIGVLILLRNLGVIDSGLYRILISWQMLIIVLGVWSMCRRHLVSGVILAGIGVFFMIPKLAPIGIGWGSIFWPFVFILLGVIVIVHLFRPSGYFHKRGHGSWQSAPMENADNKGFIDVNNSFGSVRHIVLDKVFEGARIRTTFSGTILNLKFSSLAEGETYIDVDMTLSGLEIQVPDGCKVVTDRVAMTMAGIDDKRYYVAAPDESRKLVIRGNMTLSGIEIK